MICLLVIGAGAMLFADSTTGRADAAATTWNGGYVTIMWGRSNWEAATGPTCINTAGTRHLVQNAADLKAYGLWGVGGVIIDRTDETAHQCINGNVLQASWADMATLRNTYGWKFVSQSKSYRNMETIPTNELYAETGGTLAALRAHGHMNAWGSYNYPNGKQDLEAQQMAMRYFAFGRDYVKFADGLDGVNWNGKVAGSSTVFPYPMHTLSVNGGRCNNPNLPCYNLTVTGGDGNILNMRMMSPTYLANKMMTKPTQWNVVQFYRIVDGKNTGPTLASSWDCTAEDPKDRWTGLSEMYCRSSFLDALKIYAANTERPRVVAPSDMAKIWNRFPAACTTPPECK
ncbi:MAG: hypothetical protein WBP03_00195 [Candidatus Saccharimonadales bacterium]